MTRKEIDAIMLEVHRAIEEAAVAGAADLAGGAVPDLAYPPNAGLSPEERQALGTIRRVPHLEPALRKVLADVAAAPLFALFCLFDGVSAPEDVEGTWMGVALQAPASGSSAPEDEFLHDLFFESYWAWRDRRSATWRLDTAD